MNARGSASARLFIAAAFLGSCTGATHHAGTARESKPSPGHANALTNGESATGTAQDRDARSERGPAPGAEPAHEVAARGDTKDVYLAALQVNRNGSVKPKTAQLRLGGFGGPNLGELQNRGLLVEQQHDVVTIRLEPAYPTPRRPLSTADTACSFLIDCDEPAFADRALNPNPRPSDAPAWAFFVHDYIEDKSSQRRFDVASVAARRKEGDCTEHAVLLTALLRRAGVASRVVIGFVLVDVPVNGVATTRAFGHAWTEYHDGSAWRPVDATNPKPDSVSVRYVPLQVVREEGPGFRLPLMSELHVVHVQSIALPLQD